jgi:hypothetical protein
VNAIKQFVESWSGPLFIVYLWASIWRSAYRRRRLSAGESKIPRRDPRELHTKAPFRRADFIAKAEIVRKEGAKGALIAVVILFAWYPSLVAISRLIPTLPRASLIAYQAILFVVAMGSVVVFTRRESRLARRSGLICPACGDELTGTYRGGRFQKLVQDRVIETGKCPGCRAQLLDPSEVGSVSQTLTLTLAERGVLAVLVAGLIVMLYFGRAQVRTNASNHCRRLYAGAYTASDSVVIDSTRRARGDKVNCEYFRLQHPT